MQKFISFLFIILPFTSKGQEKPLDWSRISYSLSISFHAVSTPLHKLDNNFRNVGFKAGFELPWNSKDNLRQSLEIGYYANKFNGKSLYVHSDFIYRPEIVKNVRADFRLGPGLGYIWHPSTSWSEDNGVWVQANSGKLFPQVHAAFGISYDNVSLPNHVVLNPFIQYEIVGVVGYNRSIPVFPMTMINIGSRFKF